MEIEHKSKFNSFVTKGGNIVWGGALGLAWNELIDKFVKQPIKIVQKDEEALKIVNNFNTCKFSTKDIDQRCIYIKSGYGQQTVKVINTECKKKFPEKSFSDLDIELGPHDIISYAYLLKKLQFAVKFTLFKDNSFLFENKKVPSFYAKEKKQKEQVKWYSYKGKDQFLISIGSKNPADHIYFIKDKKVQTVDEAIQLVMINQKKGGSSLNTVDQFMMPLVELNVSRNVKQLQGKSLKNQKFSNYQFSIVYQAIKLKIDEAGAIVQNQAVIVMRQRALLKQEIQPKQFILDKQFWIVMKQKLKHPYFCALIKNPEDK